LVYGKKEYGDEIGKGYTDDYGIPGESQISLFVGEKKDNYRENRYDQIEVCFPRLGK
jgi:hypothetical protein